MEGYPRVRPGTWIGGFELANNSAHTACKYNHHTYPIVSVKSVKIREPIPTAAPILGEMNARSCPNAGRT